MNFKEVKEKDGRISRSVRLWTFGDTIPVTTQPKEDADSV